MSDVNNTACVVESRLVFGYSAADAKNLLFLLLGFETLIVLGYCLVHIIAPGPHWGPIAGFLNVDREVSIPTWFSSVQLFAVGGLLVLQARSDSQFTVFLFVLGIGFLFLSLDESAAIHEKIVDSARRRLVHGWYMAWMPLYFAVGLAVMLGSYRSVSLIWRDFRPEALRIVSGAALYIVGAMGLEALSHRLYTPTLNSAFLFTVAGEELAEMAGVSIMLYGFMLFVLQRHQKSALHQRRELA